MKASQKKSLILKTAFLFERILAIVVLIAVFLGMIDVLRVIFNIYIVDFRNPVEYSQLNDILGQVLLLVIGVEFVVMLSLHIPGALIEALLYAIARKMLLIPKSQGMFDVLLGVIAIAGLFWIKKYLGDKNDSAMKITSIHDKHIIEDQDNEIDDK